jgi:hypothetical protein
LILAAHQPNYLPWLGYFDKMQSCDIFIIEDLLLLENEGFVNRNKIKTSQGPIWLTVPEEHVGKHVPIREVKIAVNNKSKWKKQHWLTIKYNYCRANNWSLYNDFFEQAYTEEWSNLMDINMHFIKGFRKFFSIDTPIIKASSLKAKGTKNDLIIAQCKELGASTYLSGIGAKCYLDSQKFEANGIKVVFQDFKHPTYTQLYGEFIPNLSAIDYLFCKGKINSSSQVQQLRTTETHVS